MGGLTEWVSGMSDSGRVVTSVAGWHSDWMVGAGAQGRSGRRSWVALRTTLMVGYEQSGEDCRAAPGI